MNASLNGIQLQDEKPKFMCLCMTQLFKPPLLGGDPVNKKEV